jgi:hypothetical protein
MVLVRGWWWRACVRGMYFSGNKFPGDIRSAVAVGAESIAPF